MGLLGLRRIPLVRRLRESRSLIILVVAVAGLLAFPFVGAGRAADADSTAASTPDSSASDSSDPRYRLDPVVVTAERSPRSLARVPSDVTVLDGAKLDREKPLFVADALREIPGIDVQRGGRLGKITDVRLRGADPRHTLVLFDGIPLNGPWVGSFDFADLGAGGLRQVEVMGGPASALYGSGAVGGVIQLLSGPAPGAGAVRAFAEAGGEATIREGATLATQSERRSGLLSVTHMTSDGSGTRDAYRGWNGVARGEGGLGTATRLRLSGLFTDGVKELPYDYVFDSSDFLTHQVNDPNYEERDRIGAGSLLVTHDLGSALSVEGDATGFKGRIENDNAPNTAGGDFQETTLDNSRWTGGLRARVVHGEALAFVAGGEYREENVTRDDDAQYGGFPTGASHVEESIHMRALYAQAHGEANGSAGRVTADAGLRVEDHSLYGAYGVPRLSAAWALPTSGLRLRAGYGRAFTAPTLTDLYYPGYGSPTLRPERSSTVEAGLDGRWIEGRLEARATWYRTDFEDLIASNSFFVADNIGRARIEGSEASARIRVTSRVSVGARAAHLPVARNLDTGARLAKRPIWREGFDADWMATRSLRFFGAWRWNDSYHDPFDFVDVNGRYLNGDTPGYAALDVGAVVSPSAWPATVRIRLDNALDRDIAEVKGLPARGRALSIGIELNP